MKCPRCNSYVKYGKMQCKKCGLHFRYSDNAKSPKKKSTAVILARVGGVMGLHKFYMGYVVSGIVRMLLFVCFLGLFVVPQLINIYQTGMFRVEPDVLFIAGMLALIVNIIFYVLAVIESVQISEGITTTDSWGFLLR